MSYCRLIDSDAYIYDSDCGVQFYVAGEFGRDLDRLCRTYNEAYQYAKTLRDEHGLDVPDYAIEALRSDALEEVEGACGPNGAVAELRAENAKLRELLAKAGELIVIAGWPDVECDEIASAVMHDIRELGIEAE